MACGGYKRDLNMYEISMKCLPFIDFSYELRDNNIEKNRLKYR